MENIKNKHIQVFRRIAHMQDAQTSLTGMGFLSYRKTQGVNMQEQTRQKRNATNEEE
jgi:hypothetical protein